MIVIAQPGEPQYLLRNLEVEVDVIIPLVDRLKAKFTKPKVGDMEGGVVSGVRRKKILEDVLAAIQLLSVIKGTSSRRTCSGSQVVPVRTALGET